MSDDLDITRVPPIIAGPAVDYDSRGATIPEGWTRVEVFELDPGRLKSFCAMVVLINLAMCLPLASAASAVTWFFDDSEPLARLVMALIVGIFMIGFFVVTTAINIYNTIRDWPTFRAVISSEGILTQSSQKPTTIILASQIKHIDDEIDSFRVELLRGKCLRLPKRVLNLQRLATRLQEKWGVRGKARRLTFALSTLGWIVMSLIMLGAYRFIITSTSVPAILGIGGAASILAILFSWRLWRIADASWWQRAMALIVAIYLPTQIALRLLNLK